MTSFHAGKYCAYCFVHHKLVKKIGPSPNKYLTKDLFNFGKTRELLVPSTIFHCFNPWVLKLEGVKGLEGDREQCCHCCFFFTRSGFFCFIWGSVVFIENLGFFDSGQILEMYVALLYFPFKNTVISQA